MHSTYLYLFILQYLDRDIRWWYGTGTGIGSSYVVGNRAYRGLYLRHGRNASFSVVLLQTCEYGSRKYFGRYQVSDTCLKKERSYRWTMSYGSTQYEVTTERFLSFLGGFRSDLIVVVVVGRKLLIAHQSSLIRSFPQSYVLYEYGIVPVLP